MGVAGRGPDACSSADYLILSTPSRETLKKTSKSGEIRLSHELNG